MSGAASTPPEMIPVCFTKSLRLLPENGMLFCIVVVLRCYLPRYNL